MLAALPALASAQFPLLTPSTWTRFSYGNGAGYPIDDFGFLLRAANPLSSYRVRVTDAYIAGDAYDILAEDVNDDDIIFHTPTVQGPGFPGYIDEYVTDDPDEAFGNPKLSWLEFTLAPSAGPYNLELSVRETAPDAPYGEAFIRFDEIEPANQEAAPEPASLVLTATGLFAIAGLRRRRRRHPATPAR